MITWGLISIAMMFVTTPLSFYTMRFLLGVAEAGLGFVEVVGNLEIHPEFRSGSEHSTEQDCGLSRDISLAIDKSVDPLYGDVHTLGQFNLRQGHGLEEFQEEDFARVGWHALLGNHVLPVSDNRLF